MLRAHPTQCAQTRPAANKRARERRSLAHSARWRSCASHVPRSASVIATAPNADRPECIDAVATHRNATRRAAAQRSAAQLSVIAIRFRAQRRAGLHAQPFQCIAPQRCERRSASPNSERRCGRRECIVGTDEIQQHGCTATRPRTLVFAQQGRGNGPVPTSPLVGCAGLARANASSCAAWPAAEPSAGTCWIEMPYLKQHCRQRRASRSNRTREAVRLTIHRKRLHTGRARHMFRDQQA